MLNEWWRTFRLRPQWKFEAGQKTESVCIASPERLFVVVASGYDTAPSSQLDIFEISVSSGRKAPLAGSIAVPKSLDLGLGFCRGDQLFLNGGDRIIVLKGAHQTAISPRVERASLVQSPLAGRDGLVYSLWSLPDTAEALITCFDDSGHEALPRIRLPGEPFHPMQLTETDLFVALRAQRAQPHGDRGHIYRLDISSFAVRSKIPFPLVTNVQGFLVRQNQLFFPDDRPIQTRPRGPYHELPPEVSPEREGARVEGWQELGQTYRSWLLCHDSSTLDFVKAWCIGRGCRDLSGAPDRAALFVTVTPNVFDTGVELMLGSNTGPLSIGFWSGESDGPAVWAEGRVCWLADLGGLEFLDSVFEKRGMSDKPLADVHMMDPAAGEHRVVRLRLPSRGTKISFHAGLLIITVSNGVVAYAVDDLWTAALPVRNVPLSAVSTEWNSVPVSGAIVGALLHGPTGDDWGYEYVDDFLHKVLDPVFDKLVESDLQVRSEFEEPFWKANPSQRLRLIDGLTNNLLKWVFEAWPDSDALLAAKTFRHSAGDTRTITAVQATPFGGLPQNPGLAESMSKRLHDLPFGDFAPEAIGTSRFLLYEHIRRCINEVPFNVALDGWLWEEKADRQIRARVSPELARTLSWCDLDLLDPRSARAMLVHFIECWPRGRPPWKGAVQEYLQFLADCMHYGLVCRLKPNTLSAALARMWRDPRHPSRHDAFISYSRRDEEIANVVAEGLSKRGLRVGLDRWEIEPDLDQRSVEMWMAESVMSSVARVLLVSDHALRSGWVTREIDWDFQLLGAKRAAALPFVVSIDAAASRMMEHYPGSRLISGAVLEDGARRSGVLEELALRIGIDCLAMFVDGSDGCIFGLEGFVGAPEVEVRWTT